jgi:hypothetical protein
MRSAKKILSSVSLPPVATITFSSLTNNGNIYLLGGAQGTDLNVNGTATASGFTFSQTGQTGFTAPSQVGQGPGTVDGFGIFNLTIDYFNGFKNAFNSVTFSLTATGGTTWSSAANVLAFNNDGFDAAAHIFVTPFPAANRCCSRLDISKISPSARVRSAITCCRRAVLSWTASSSSSPRSRNKAKSTATTV